MGSIGAYIFRTAFGACTVMLVSLTRLMRATAALRVIIESPIVVAIKGGGFMERTSHRTTRLTGHAR
jgi:predicted tellurium resistance membrane protein TerC